MRASFVTMCKRLGRGLPGVGLKNLCDNREPGLAARDVRRFTRFFPHQPLSWLLSLVISGFFLNPRVVLKYFTPLLLKNLIIVAAIVVVYSFIKINYIEKSAYYMCGVVGL